MVSVGKVASQLSTRDQVMISQFKKMGASNEQEYENKIKSLNLVDLCSHAIQFEIAPNVERKRIEKSLISIYRKNKARYDLAYGEGEMLPSPELSLEKKERALAKLKFIRS